MGWQRTQFWGGEEQASFFLKAEAGVVGLHFRLLYGGEQVLQECTVRWFSTLFARQDEHDCFGLQVYFFNAELRSGYFQFCEQQQVVHLFGQWPEPVPQLFLQGVEASGLRAFDIFS